MKRLMNTCLYLFLGLVLFFSISGCATSPYLEEPKNDQVSLVVGYIDMAESPANLGWVQIKQLQPDTKKPYFGFLVVDGMFYNPNLVPGIFKFIEFGGNPKFFLENAIYTFSFPAQGKGEWDPVIEKPGIYFVGSYKYKKIQTGLFEQGKFNIIKIDSPTEKEVLEKLLKYTGKTKWKQRVLDRIGELEK
jgi:hypothetical protein